jgi:hypothetical protein
MWSPISRPTMSGVEPGPNGTMTRTVFVGQSCAAAVTGANNSAENANAKLFFISLSLLTMRSSRSASSLALLVFLRGGDCMISVITGEAIASMDLPRSQSRSRGAPTQGPPCLATCHGLYWRRTQ